jgi:hypothetical protein
MKKKHHIRATANPHLARMAPALGIFLLLLGASCVKEQEDEPAALVEARLSFSAAGGSGFVRVNTAQGVEASTDQPSWCTASVSRDSVKVAAVPNTAMSGRTALLTVRAGGRELYVPVTQEGAILSCSAGEVPFEGGGGRRAVALKNTAGRPCEVSLPAGDGWLSCEVKSDSLIFTATPSNARRRTSTAVLTTGEGRDRRTLKLAVEQLSFAGSYIAAYYDYDGTTHRDTVAIAASGEATASGESVYYLENLKPNNASQALSYRTRIRCAYKNRWMRMSAGQALQKIEYTSPVTHAPDSVTLRLMALNRSREVATFSPDASYSAEVQVNDDASITLRFGSADDQWLNIAVEGIATGGINAVGQYVGRFDSYIFLTLTSMSYEL